jgi:hypothetical protein
MKKTKNNASRAKNIGIKNQRRKQKIQKNAAAQATAEQDINFRKNKLISLYRSELLQRAMQS